MCWHGAQGHQSRLAPGSVPGPFVQWSGCGSICRLTCAAWNCRNNFLCGILIHSRLPGLGNTGASDLSRYCVCGENRLFLLLCCAVLLVGSLGWLWQELMESRGWAEASKATPEC